MSSIPVNPPPQLKLPSAFAKDPEIRAYYKNFDRFMLQLWRRTGGAKDNVSDLREGELFESSTDNGEVELLEDLMNDFQSASSGFDERLSALENSSSMSELNERLDDLDGLFSGGVSIKELENILLGTGETTITTTGDSFVTCLNTAAGTVTLNSHPEDGEDCIIWRGDSTLTVVGDINGSSSINIISKYDAPHLKFSQSANVWTIV